jgi:SAM-dependent methyltransferase
VKEGTPLRTIVYLSAPAEVRMADQWFDIADTSHFWVRRRFEVLQRLAGKWISSAQQMAEIGCGHGLLQRQIEDAYGSEVTGFDLNEYALKRNVSRSSQLYCYDISQLDVALQERFDVIFLFDVLEHIADEDEFLKAILFHLKAGGKLIVNVPAGQCAYSTYDKAVGHVRRYSIGTLQKTAQRNHLETTSWTYWGLPLVPTLLLRKLWLMGWQDQDKIVSVGLDSRTPAINKALGILSRCEPIPQKILGTSLLAVFSMATQAPNPPNSR